MSNPTSNLVSFDSLPLGARFKYPGKPDLFVKLENGGNGVVAEWAPTRAWIGQGIYSFADSEAERARGMVEWVDGAAAETSGELEEVKAQLAEWQRWTQGHVWIKNEEYAELCELKREHGPAPLRPELASVPYLDSVRLEWLFRHISGAEWRRLGITTSAGMNRMLLNDAMVIAESAVKSRAEPRDGAFDDYEGCSSGINTKPSASTGDTPPAPTSPVECPKCRTQLAFDGDECGLCKEEES